MRFTSMDTYAGQELCPRCDEDEAGDSWPSCADGHPHSETCAKKTYREYVCDRCEFELNGRPPASEYVCKGPELNTQLPTSGMLCGKSKWEVERHPVNAGSAEHVWCAFHSEENIEETHRHFPTWRDALAYADQRARTREVVLPRPQLNEDGKLEFDFTEWAGLDYTPEWPDGATYDRRTGPNKPAFGASVLIPRERWKPLALALLALHYQQEVAE